MMFRFPSCAGASALGVLILILWSSPPPTVADFKYERNIAFSVERSSPMGASTESREVGSFNRNSQTLYLNTGDALDTTTGRFTAPRDGVYAFYYSFSSSVLGATSPLELLKLERGEDDVAEATSLVTQALTPSITYMNVDIVESASASVLVELARRDRVFLRLAPGLLDATGSRPLIFTGYMVYRTNDHVYVGFK